MCSKSVLVCNFSDYHNDDYDYQDIALAQSRSGSVLIPTIEAQQLDHIVKNDLEEKKYMEYYDYMKQNFTTIDQIIYSTSKNMVGKRNLDKTLNISPKYSINGVKIEKKLKYDDEECTELVHRISLSDIKVKLETVETEKVSIDYSLMFYVSKGPLEFK